MKKSVFALTLLALVSLGSARNLDQIKRDGTIVVATEGAFQPFNFFKGQTLTGFEVDLAKAVAKQMGVKVRFVTQPFDSLLIGLNQNRYDFVIASHGITPERAKAVDFTSPHYCTGGAIVSRAGGPTTVAALAGKTVAVQVGTTYLENVRKVSGVGKVNTYPKDTDAQQALLAGRADAWVSDKFGGLDAVKASNGRLQQGALLFQERIAMAVKKNNPTLVKALNDALAALQKSGEYARISNTYFGQDIRCR